MAVDERAHRVGRHRAALQPEVDALLVHLHDGGLGARVVVTEDLDERAVARRARIGDDDAEERTLLGPCPTQTNRNHLTLLNGARGPARASDTLRSVFRAPPLAAVAQHLHGLAARLLAAAGEPGHPAELFQHLLHLHELLQQSIHFFDRGAAALRDALAAAAVDDVLFTALIRRHRADDRLDARHLLFIPRVLGQTLAVANPGHHAHDRI